MRKSLLACALLAVPMAALAAPDFQSRDLFNPNDGFITLDNTTGLEWLDVSLTQGLTVDNVLGGAGGWLDAGFRYATFYDLSVMLTDAGLRPLNNTTFGTKSFIEDLASASDFGPQLGGLLGPTAVSPTGQMSVDGYTAPFACRNLSECDTSPFFTDFVRLNTFPPSAELGGRYDAAMTVSDSSVSTSGSVFGNAGSWLVRGTYATGVPEPGTLGLFALGLVALWVTRGKHSRRTVSAGEPQAA